MFAQSWELSWWPGLSSSRVLWVSRGEDWRGCPEVRGPERPPTASIWYRCPAQEVEAQRRFPVTSCGVSCCVQSVECVAACLLTSESTDAARVLIQKWSWHQCWGLSGFLGNRALNFNLSRDPTFIKESRTVLNGIPRASGHATFFGVHTHHRRQ